MDYRALVPVVLLLAGGIVLAVSLTWLRQHGWGKATRPGGARRGVGHALLGLQQFVEPSVEYIFAAENLEEKDHDEDDVPDPLDRDVLMADLASSLACDPIDSEEIRRHLTAALRAGLDWHAAFDEAVAAELADRPYRRPSMPPVWRVAPRE